jgi:ankyrin repeat protein
VNISYKNIAIVLLTLFLESTMDLNVQQKDHETPLHFACFQGKLEIAQLLLNHGAQVDAKNYQGETPLHLVSRGEYDSLDDGVCVAELLLERGTDANAYDSDDWSPLHSASNNGKPEIVQVLLAHGAKVDAENDLGETPLHLVRQGKYGSQFGVRVAQLLLNSGADVNARDKRYWTPLLSASYYGRREVAQVLLDHGAIAKVEDNQGKTPLHQLSQGSFESEEAGGHIAELFLERGVSANAQDENRETPLHVASRCGRLEIVRVLLGHASVKNARSRTSSHLGFEGAFSPQYLNIVLLTIS